MKKKELRKAKKESMNENKFKIERKIILVGIKIVERKTTKERRNEKKKQLKKRIEEKRI